MTSQINAKRKELENNIEYEILAKTGNEWIPRMQLELLNKGYKLALKEFLEWIEELINAGYSNNSLFEELIMNKEAELKKSLEDKK